jgi:ubiquinone/menaquinone biosynthesis C-methylase UbiE
MADSRETEQLAVRSTAVEHHHADAGRFMRWYSEMAESRFANAFAYGRHKVDVLLDQALKELPAGARILDVGCGTGEYVRRLTELGFQVSGLEPAEAMRQAAIEKNPGSKILDGIATQIPFPDESIDFVICIEVLRYLHRADVDLALGEMRRILKPGGRMFLTMVNRYALDGFYLAYHARKLVGGGLSIAAPHCEFVTPAEVDAQVRHAGFSAATHSGVLFGPMRVLYKISTGLARKLAPMLEPIDDAICNIPATTRFAGHLVTIATR